MNTRRRILGIAVALVMVLTMIPTPAFAYIGAVRLDSTEKAKFTEVTKDGETFAVIKNSYIQFWVCTKSSNRNHLGHLTYTAATGLMKDAKNVEASESAYINFKYTVGKHPESGAEAPTSANGLLRVKTVSPSFKDGKLVVEYTFEKDATNEDKYSLTAKGEYELLELDAGDYSSPKVYAPFQRDTSDDSNNWGVHSNIEFYSGIEWHDNTQQEINRQKVEYVSMYMTMPNFAAMGHKNMEGADVYASKIAGGIVEDAGPKFSMQNMRISSGLKETNCDTSGITEINTGDSYPAFGNPFVATSDHFYSAPLNSHWTNYGVENHNYLSSRGLYAQSVKFEENELMLGYGIHAAYPRNSGYFTATFSGLWGFRDLGTKEEVLEVTDPDQVYIASDAQYLGIFPNGSNKWQAIPAADVNALNTLAKKYGKCAVAYRGTFAADTAKKKYIFQGTSAQISQSVSAVWGTLDKEVFSVGYDGKLNIDQKEVSLNAPSFKFYQPKGSGGLSFQGYTASGGLKLQMDPTKNDAVISLDFPGCACKLKGADIAYSGDLVFNGDFELNTVIPLATINMDKLGYKLEKGQLKMNGIHCEGDVTINSGSSVRRDAKIVGFLAADINGEINTFDGDETYSFKLQLDVRDLFKTAATLQLKRLSNGRLCPNNLGFEIKINKAGVGLDIPPGTPVVTLTGGGGGIENLADTIKGDYRTVPPVKLIVKATGQIVKVVDGSLQATIGPSQISLAANNMAIVVPGTSFKASIIEHMEAGLFAQGKEAVYKEVVYDGVHFGGYFEIGIKIMNVKNAKTLKEKAMAAFNGTIRAEANLSISGYVGEKEDFSLPGGYRYVYLGLVGKAAAGLYIPEDVPIIGSWEIGGAGLDVCLAGQTACDDVSSAFKNLKIGGGIVATGSLLGSTARVIYIIPDDVSFDYKIAGSLPSWDWGDALLQDSTQGVPASGEMLMAPPEVVETEDGQQAIMLITTNLSPVKMKKKSVNNLTRSLSYGLNYQVDLSDIEDGEMMMLAVKPKDQADIDDLAQSLSVNGMTISNTKLKYAEKEFDPENQKDYYVAQDGDNAWIGTADTDEDGNVTEQAVFVNLTKEQLAETNGNISITSAVPFKTAGAVSHPITALDVAHRAGGLAATVSNMEEGADYSISTYYGTKDEDGNVKSEYLVESRDIDNTGNESEWTADVALPDSGDLAPSGDYYVTTVLNKTMVYDVELTDEDGNYVDEDGKPSSEPVTVTRTTDVTVESWSSTDTVHYTNSMAPSVPENITLQANSNETMLVSWKESVYQDRRANKKADGYEITLYQKGEGGAWIDTGRGYSFKASDFEETEGLSYDENTHTYTLNMAVTTGGSGEGFTVEGEDGNTITIDDETAAETAALAPGKDYKVSIKAFRDEELSDDMKTAMGIGDEDRSIRSYSAADMSEAVNLPEYEPALITSARISDVTGEEPLICDLDPSKKNDEGFFEATIVSGDRSADKYPCLEFTTDKDDTGNVDKAAAIADTGEPLEKDPNGDFIIPEFDGSVMIEMKSTYHHGGVEDDYYEYVKVEKDDIAPLITTASDIVYAEDDGSYEVKGVTEAGTTITYGDKSLTVPESGNFTIKGNLGDQPSADIDMTVSDDSGNNSNASVLVQRKTDISKASISGVKTKTYNGKAQTQKIKVMFNGSVLSTDAYKVTYKNNKNAGTATLTVSGKGAYTGSRSVKFTIKKAANTMKVKTKKVNLKFKNLSKKALTVKKTKAFKITKAKGKVTFKKVSVTKKKYTKKFSIGKKNGKIKVKKGLKKGTYKVKVKVTAAGDKNYTKKSKTVTVKIIVK